MFGFFSGADSNTCYANILFTGLYTDDNITNQDYETEYFKITDDNQQVAELRSSGDPAPRVSILGPGPDGFVSGSSHLYL